MFAAANAQHEARQRRGFLAIAALIVLLALSVRVAYVAGEKIDYPIRGDINQYVLYAWNLTHRGVFSTALPDVDVAPSDSYRGPGYPAMLATTMILAGHSDLPLRAGPEGNAALGLATDTWMQLAYAFQIILGAATAALTIVLARFWLGRGWSLGAGLLVALWPHLISFTGILLSETLFAFVLMLSIVCLCAAERRNDWRIMSGAGLCWGLTYLVNPIVFFFIPLIALALRSRQRLALVLLASFALAPFAWTLRSAGVEGGSAVQRVEENFVQGSWPQYHAAENSRFDNAISQQILSAIDEEIRVMRGSLRAGLGMTRERMALDPPYYLSWYLLQKPYLLWDWSIRVGAGDIYFLPVERSPFERIAALAAIRSAYQQVNPLIFALAGIAALGLLFVAVFRSGRRSFAATAVAVFVLYVTFVHVLLQAEPRYSVAYRPAEALLALTAVAWLLGLVAKRSPLALGQSADAGVAGAEERR
jgi:hypothetical protein